MLDECMDELPNRMNLSYDMWYFAYQDPTIVDCSQLDHGSFGMYQVIAPGYSLNKTTSQQTLLYLPNLADLLEIVRPVPVLNVCPQFVFFSKIQLPEPDCTLLVLAIVHQRAKSTIHPYMSLPSWCTRSYCRSRSNRTTGWKRRFDFLRYCTRKKGAWSWGITRSLSCHWDESMARVLV